MKFTFDERASDSFFVERIWRTHSESAGAFISRAESHWEIVVMKQYGRITVTVRGPETKATAAYCPENAEFLGIRFQLGTYMPDLSARSLLDGEVNLEASKKFFWLDGTAWQLPDYENADIFVGRLVRSGLLVCEPVVEAALQGKLKELSPRSVQRRFLSATGLTQGAVRQIERAREALTLLEQGVSILDTVEQLGYADQPHLTRALKRLIGETPAQILERSKAR